MKRAREQTVDELRDKYDSLVSFARKSPEHVEANPDLKRWCEEVERKYPDEVAALADPDEGDWTHGFNSGALAVTRLLSVLYTTRSLKVAADAIESFPELST